MGWLVWDTETRNGVTDLADSGSWRYAECPCTEVLCACFRDHFGRKEYWQPGMNIPALWQEAVYKGWLIIAHNVAFEKAILRKILVPEFHWPPIPNDQWMCTQSVCAMQALPLALDNALTALNLPGKDLEGSAYVKSLSKFDRKGYLPVPDMAVVRRYCEQDVDVEVDLFLRTGELPPHEREMWLYDQLMNERGVRIDLAFVEAARALVQRARAPLVAEFKALTGLPALGSPKLKEWLLARGVSLVNLRAETIDELLAGDTTQLECSALRALHIRRMVNSSSVKKLDTMLDVVNFDGRCRGGFQWHGTVPGRAAGRGIQWQNLPRGFPFDYDPDLLVSLIMDGDIEMIELIFGNPIEAVASALRHAIIPDPGKKFISGDFAQIQARIVLAIAGQHDKTAIMAKGQDIYCDMATAIYKRPITRKDKAERQTGKNAALGLGFGMGWEKFKLMYARNMPDEFCQSVVDTYRNEWAPLVGKPGQFDAQCRIWTKLQSQATKAVWGKPQIKHPVKDITYSIDPGTGALVCEVPSGHKIFYRRPGTCQKDIPKEYLKPGGRTTYDDFYYHTWMGGAWRKEHSFGGMLTENVVMRLEVDIKNAAIRNLEKAGYPVVLDIHDELVCEVEDPDPKTFKECMLNLPDWVKHYNIPVAISEPGIWDRYRK